MYCEFWRKKLLNPTTTTTTNEQLIDFDHDLCRVIAELSDGFSFAYMKELFVIALLTIARGGHGDIIEDDDDDKASQAGGEEEGAKSPIDADPVIVEHENPPTPHPAPGAITTADATPLPGTCCKAPLLPAENKAAPPAPKKKRVLPDVDVPAHLRENLLLRVIKSQLKILVEEMDNTSEDEWMTSKARKSAGGGGPVWPFMGNLGLGGAGEVDEGDCC